MKAEGSPLRAVMKKGGARSTARIPVRFWPPDYTTQVWPLERAHGSAEVERSLSTTAAQLSASAAGHDSR